MQYTLLVTSCDRHDLLARTLESFVNCADIMPRRTVIVEDGDKPSPSWLRKIGLGPHVEWINHGSRLGQIATCDRLWQECQTDYAFWCEDDWLFTNANFIRPSLDILGSRPSILQVSLRADWNHPTVLHEGIRIAEPYWGGDWGGLSFNPGLRRRADYRRIGNYAKHVGLGEAGLGHEKRLSRLYLDLGYRIAALDRGCCIHIGGGRSRAIEPLPPAPRILVAIPACHRYDYKQWESELSPTYDARTNFCNKPYGTDIHITGSDTPRIRAVRETWWRDLQAHSNVEGKFFYGVPHPVGSVPAPDEVFVNVPDDYSELPRKTIAIARYALGHDFDFVFKCDDDTYVWVDRLVREIMEHRPEYGGFEHGGVCTGGPGWILGRKAMQVVSTWTPDHWAEDVSVAKALSHTNIKPTMLSAHTPGFSAHWVDINRATPEWVTAHAVKPEDMIELYRRENPDVPSRP